MKSPRGSFLPSFLLVTVGLLLLGVHVLRPKAQTTEETATPCCAQPDTTAPRQLEFPYYSLRDGFYSNLLLVSDSPKPLDFVLAVHSRSGQTLLAPSMSIQPQEKLPVDLAVLLASLSADITGDFAEGSVSIYFNGTFMPLAGQLTMTNPTRRLILESEMVDNSPGLGLLPPVLNAVWWGLGGGREARIMITNTGGENATADVFLDFQGERHTSEALVFSAHETKVLSIAQLLGDLKVSPAQAPEGGITIIQRGPKPALIAQGKITDPATGFSTSLNFADPSVQWANALHASGVPIGLPTKDSPFAGTSVFIPHVVVRNLTGSAQTASITIEYPGDKGAQETALPPVALGPYSTVDVSLDSVFGLLPLPVPHCSIRIQYSGAPGTVIGEVSSVESNGDLVIDSRVANEGDGWAGSGAHPWHLDDETESVLFLTNMSDLAASIGFQVQAGGVHFYLTDLQLEARETRAIDLRKLRDAQQPDFKGNVIPSGATDGSVLWIRLDNVPVMGRLVVMQRHKGLASNYDCFTCNCPASMSSGGIVTPAALNLLVTATGQDTGTAPYHDCNQNYSYYNVTSSSTWSPTSNPVAWVNNGGAKGLVTAVSGGSQSIGFSYPGFIYVPSGSNNCVSHPIVCVGSAPANVAKLTCGASSGSQSAVTRGATAYCTASNLPTGATISEWKFTEGSTTVTTSSTSTSWSGTAVKGGTVSVKVTSGTNIQTPSASLTVNARNWHTNPASAAQVPNGTFVTLPVPPQSSGNDAGLGYFRESTSDPGAPSSTIIASGPNAGYAYWASQLAISTLFQYEINPDLENSASVFSTKQYGACGFISWSNLLAQTRRHEYNSTTQSHHAFYKNSMNSAANNPGDFVEKQVASPDADLIQFASDTRGGLDARYNQIGTDSGVQPFAVNLSETGTFLGNINYAPYASCP